MFIDVDGHKVFALSFGAGPRTFLAQGGWIGSSEVWLPTLELLSPRWRTVAFDHRGAGATVVPVDAIAYGALVDDVFRVLDALRVERCVIGGESAGTQVVLDAVLRAPGRFDGVVLVDRSGGLPRPPTAPPSPITGPPDSWPGADHRARMRWFTELCFPEPDAEHLRRWGHDILMRADPAASKLWGIGRAAAAGMAERVAEIKQPVLLVYGSADPLAPREVMAAAAQRLPVHRLVEVAGAGHVPIMTRPAEVAAAIEGFFAVR